MISVDLLSKAPQVVLHSDLLLWLRFLLCSWIQIHTVRQDLKVFWVCNGNIAQDKIIKSLLATFYFLIFGKASY